MKWFPHDRPNGRAAAPPDSRRRGRRWLWLGLWVFALAFQFPHLGRAPSIYDEGLILAGADRILQGEIPFRDFWNTHPPGQIWIVAGLFRLFGPAMLVLRLYDAIVRASVALLLYVFAARMAPRPVALLAFAVSMLWLEFFPYYGYTVFPVLLAAYLALAFLARTLGNPAANGAARSIFTAGLLAGVGILFRLDFGVYLFATGGAVIGLAELLGRTTPWPARARGACATLFRFTAGCALVVLTALLVLAVQGVGLDRLETILITYPNTAFAEFRGMPVPPLNSTTLIYHVPAWICLAGLAMGLITLFRRKDDSENGLFWIGLALLPLVAWPHARTRADLTHQFPLLLSAVPLAGGLGYRLWHAKGWRRALALLALPGLYLTFKSDHITKHLAEPPQTIFGIGDGLPRSSGVRLQADQAAAVRAAQRRTAPGDAIYVGTGRHDKLFANDALFYFLAGRRCATAYHNLLPGLATREDIQREIAEDLDRQAVRCLVLATQYDAKEEPNASGIANGSRLLDERIRNDFALAETIGPYEIWTRPISDEESTSAPRRDTHAQ